MKKLGFAMAMASVVALSTAASADEKKPLSPPAQASATIAGKKITVDYSAPSMRGRKIMGELVPLGKVWRTGANAATTLKTEADLMIGNLAVPKGTYTLYTIPDVKGWTLIINKQTGQWGTEYSEAQDLGRVAMNVSSTRSPEEAFIIAVMPAKEKSGALQLRWENTVASVPITVK